MQLTCLKLITPVILEKPTVESYILSCADRAVCLFLLLLASLAALHVSVALDERTAGVTAGTA